MKLFFTFVTIIFIKININKLMKLKFKPKRWHIVLSIIFVIIFLILFFLSDIIRSYVVKNSEKLIGRKIELKELHINYFKCSFTAKDFVLYEKNKKETFVSFEELYINFAPWHLFKKEYAISEFRLVKPYVSLIYSKEGFNFKDMMTSTDTTKITKAKGDTVRYLVEHINIIGGNIKYQDKTVGSITDLKKISLNIPKIAWNNSKSDMGIDFVLGENGKVALSGIINPQSAKYTIKVKTENIDVEPFAGYFKSYMDAGLVKGLLYSDVSIDGKMDEPMKFIVSGTGGLKDVLIKDVNQKHFCSATDAYAVIDSIDMGRWNFCFNTIKIENPHLTVSLDKKGNNVMRIFAPYFKGATTTAEGTVTADSTAIHYSIENMIVKNGKISYTDLTLKRPFLFDVNDLNMEMKGFGDTKTKIPLDFSMVLNHTGTFKGKTVLNMINPFNIKFDGSIANLDVVCFSPYFEYFVARPLTKGRFNYDCKLAMTTSSLSNENKLKIVNIEVGKKLKDKPVYKVPIGLALYILKDRNDIIDIDLPVSGNPKDPKFKLSKIVWKTLEEFLLKAITSPFKAIGNLFGSNPESIKQIPFEFLQDSLTSDQRGNLDKIAEIIVKKHGLAFNFIQTTDPDKEKALIANQKAKVLYVKTMQPNADPSQLNSVASTIKDNTPEFCAFLGLQPNASAEDITKACFTKVGTENVLITFNQLLDIRKNLLTDYFNGKKLPLGSVMVRTADLRNLPDDLKKPQFTVDLTLK